MEGDARKGRPPGMAGDGQGARPAWASGPETNIEGSRTLKTSALVMWVHAGRRKKKTQESASQGTGTQREREGEAAHGVHKKKDTPGEKSSMHHQRTYSTV